MMFGYQWRRGVDSWAMNRLNICIKWARDSAQKCFTCDNLAQITTSTIAEVFAILSPKKKIFKGKSVSTLALHGPCTTLQCSQLITRGGPPPSPTTYWY